MGDASRLAQGSPTEGPKNTPWALAPLLYTDLLPRAVNAEFTLTMHF